MFEKIRQSLTKEDILEILAKYGVSHNKSLSTENYFVFPTCCHNPLSDTASYKLYYYFDSKMFKCYTECDALFDIITLLQKIYELNYEPISISKAIELTGYNKNQKGFHITEENSNEDIYKRYKKKNDYQENNIYSKTVLKAFVDYYPKEWLNEGITKQIMDLFNIKFNIIENQIVIPYFDINGNLIGVRVRNLSEGMAKYMPLKFENIFYTHSIKNNLYGIYENQNAIRKYKMAILVEGEKSTLKLNGYGLPISVAVGGSSIHTGQKKLLQSLGVNEIVIAFDRDYEKQGSLLADNYYNLLLKKAEDLSANFKTSFIYDFKNILGYKDSPVDKGKENFLYLFKNKITLRG